MDTRIKSYLPIFPGFYNTPFEACEDYYIEEGKTYENYDWDYNTYNKDVANSCVKAIEKKLIKLGFNLSIAFENIYSPSYYNYSNDSINVTYILKKGCVTAIKKYVQLNLSIFTDYLRGEYTSYSGFISFYSTDPATWLQYLTIKNLKSNTHYLGSILEFILQNERYDTWSLYHDTIDADGISIYGIEKTIN